MKRAHAGFTLSELLVVIAIIGVLASVVLASLNSARENARDARRMSDINQIITALVLYNSNEGTWIQGNSGCGQSGGGNGWFSHSAGTYPKSIAQCLVDAGVVGEIIIDPSGDTWSTPSAGNAYMKYTCTQSGGTVTYVYAKLETEDQDATATDGTCCPGCDTSYGMNYYKQI